MDDLLTPLREIFEGQIDFHGQQVTDTLSTVLLTVVGAIAFITGYLYQDVFLTLWVGLAGTLVTMLIVVPPWGVYNKHPEPWLTPGTEGIDRSGIVIGKANG